jgi:hypothetical protein
MNNLKSQNEALLKCLELQNRLHCEELAVLYDDLDQGKDSD